jgi:nucleotide-binding universal stress UspA family protein
MHSIVVGTDGSAGAKGAVARAADIAKGTGARVHLVAAFPDIASPREMIASSAKSDRIDLRQAAEGVLTRAGRQLEDQGVDFEAHAVEGDPAQAILEVAEEQSADLVVVGARGQSALQRFLLGSVSSKLSHHSPVSVMVVRDD